MSRLPWNVLEPLPEGAAWLLEASAGTGKTYQLASLFLRLVGEYGVAIDRILAMTFTNAATSELRERVRLRLEDALHVCTGRSTSNDLVLAHVREAVANDEELARRLTLAIQCFDTAPIRTIHGFSQSILQELAFETGHDRSLTLAESADDIAEELVNDALADLWSRATAAQVRILGSLDLSRTRLLAVVRATTGAQRPVIEASAASEADARAGDPWRTLLQQTEAFSKILVRFGAAHFGPEGDSPAVRSFLAAVEGKGLFKGNSMGTVIAQRTVEHLRKAATLGTFTRKGQAGTDYERFEDGKIRSLYRGKAIESEPFWPFFQDIHALFAAAEDFAARAEPLAAFALLARPRLELALARRRAITFDGLITALADRVEHELAEGGSSALAATLRGRSDAVLVDEFQDTDAAQWLLLREAFLGHRRLFLIGDPKQAIYAFRGANVHVYLEAANAIEREPARARTMTTNWRSDGHAVRAMNASWRAGSEAFDTPGVDYVQVEAEPKRQGVGLTPALEFHWMDARLEGGEAGVALTNKDRAASLATELAASAVLELLEGTPPRGALEATAPVLPREIAVLTFRHADAEAMRDALVARGVPAVYTSRHSVFATEAALWLQRWLEAVAAYGHPRAVRLLALTPLVDWSAEEIAHARESEEAGALGTVGAAHAARMEALVEHVRATAERWEREGFGRLFDRDSTHFETFPRLLAMPLGERIATDLRHLFELTHAHERRHRSSAAALAAWLERERAGAEDSTREVSQRLESDARAVTIETVHASKGLEYGYVLLPFCWQERTFEAKDGPVKIAGPSGARVNLEGAASARRSAAADEVAREEAREAQRKLYVALTRAKHRTLAWIGPLTDGGEDLARSALGRVVLRDPEKTGVLREGELVAPRPRAKAAERLPMAAALVRTVEARLDALVRRSEGTVAWRIAEREPQVRRYALKDLPPVRELAAPWPAARPALISPWQTTSFTALTRAATALDENQGASTAPGEVTTDEREAPSVEPAVARSARKAELTLTKGGGTAYGTFVHEVFEHVDFRTGHALDGRSLEVLAREAARRTTVGEDAATELAGAMPSLLAASLARPEVLLPEGFSLSSIARDDRLDELAFDLALGAGTRWQRGSSSTAGLVALERVVDAMRAAPEVLPPAWVSDFERRVRSGRLATGLVGILRGAIDLVFRVPSPRGDRAFVVDYKTNRLPGSSLESYAREGMGAAMREGDYLLQALLYTVALHRELRLRLRSYRYDDHVGGFLYLFVRGLGAASSVAGEPCPGVYADRFPEALVVAVDEALRAGERT